MSQPRLFRWVEGRQGTGYAKMLLGTGTWPLPFDLYLLRFREGHEIPPHVDQVDHGDHYRANLILKAPKVGGEFRCDAPIHDGARLKVFRPDTVEHAVTRIEKGSRYVLSVGWIRNAHSP